MIPLHGHWWNWWEPLYSVFHNLLPVIVGGGGALGGQTLWQKLRQRRAAAWPSADGEVQSVDIRRKNGYTVLIQYRYYARSQYHYGKYARHFRRKQQADQFAEALRGRRIQVRYQEDKPSVSVILDQDLRMTGALQIG
jgi:Protein of unknown function (DUF3592)